MSSIVWDEEIAGVYDETYDPMPQAAELGPMLDVLAGLAAEGPALEFAIGIGRVALPLSARGIAVRGIELSPAMAERLSAKAGAGGIPVTAAHLAPGGCFVVEVIVPQLRRVPPGEVARVFTLEPGHVGIETFDDLAGQIAWSHHWIVVRGRLVRHSAPYRYVWPSELDLMARLTGFRLRDRWAGWDQAPFTSDSQSQVAVFEKLPG